VTGPSDNGVIRNLREFYQGSNSREFVAQDIRKERTGVHARISIFVDKRLLEYDTFNIGRRSDRNSLANAAHKAMEEFKQLPYTSTEMRHDLALFCGTLWRTYLAQHKPGIVIGDPLGEPTSFLVEPFILEDAGTILFAPPGRGKSYIAMLMAVSMDAGISQLWQVKQAKTMFVNLERSKRSIERRLGSVNTALGEDPARGLLMLNARGKSFEDVRDIVAGAIENDGVECVMLDSISRAGYGDLTENKSVNSIIDALNNLNRTWFAIGHTPRGDETHVFGGVHFDAGADIMVRGFSQQTNENLGVGLKITKANDLPFYPMQVLSLSFDQFGLTGVQKANRSEFADMLAEASPSGLADTIEQFLTLEVAKASPQEIAAAIGKDRSNVAKVLHADQRFVAVGTEGKSKLWGVVASSG
jgi:hypothetical protein